MARKFLYVIAGLILLTMAVLFAMRIWADRLTEIAFVPTGAFEEQAALSANAYQDPAMWFSRPGKSPDPARWQPPLAQPAESAGPGTAEGGEPQAAAGPAAAANDQPQPAPPRPAQNGTGAEPEAQDGAEPAVSGEPVPDFALFFVHPTSFLDRSHWNAPLDDPPSQDRARLFLRGLASPFGVASEVWAPRYRQATFGAFLTDAPEAQQAIDAAYRDVEQAFAFFVESIDADKPIVIAGHSQGALHLLRLLREEIAGTELQERVAAVYAVGWPISIAHDLPALGLPACATPAQGGCIASWSSFAEPAEPGRVLETYRESTGFDGELRGDSPILCLNPLTGTLNGAAPASANLGTLVPNDALTDGELLAGAVPARCDERGLLLIGDPPALGPYVLPGNNYHVYDIPLFWQNVRADVVRRVRGWSAR